MYIDTATIMDGAELVGILATAIGVLRWGFKFVERDKRQSKKIAAIQTEQKVMCYGVLACLKGLKEQGCNGPVTEALNKMEKHLNVAAHDEDL